MFRRAGLTLFGGINLNLHELGRLIGHFEGKKCIVTPIKQKLWIPSGAPNSSGP